MSRNDVTLIPVHSR